MQRRKPATLKESGACQQNAGKDNESAECGDVISEGVLVMFFFSLISTGVS